MLYHITFALRRGGEMGSSKYELMWTIVTDFLINSSKYVLLKLSVLKNYILFVLKIANQ